MHVGHEAEDPDEGVRRSLFEPSHDGRLSSVLRGIELNTVVGEVLLVLGEPPSGERRVGKKEKANNGDDKGNGTPEFVSDARLTSMRCVIHTGG